VNRRRAVAVLTLLAVAIPAFATLAPQPAASGAKPSPAAVAPIARVGGRPIAAAELDQRAQQLLADYARRQGGELPADMRDMARRQVLEGLVRAQLLTLEVKRLGQGASEAEGEALLREMPLFNPGGRFDAARYDGIKKGQPAQFAAALAEARDQVAARKLAAATEQRLSPPEAQLRAGATRSLTLATLDLLPLRTVDFEGAFDQPRESDVLDWYRTHMADYRREARASLTLVFVNTPALADSLRGVPSAVSDWDQRMRAEAERIISRVGKGEVLDSVAAELGPRSKVVVETGNFPGYWHATAAQSARIFDPAGVGRVQPEPVRGVEGWIVVRVDEATPAHLAPLREVARDIRTLLRQYRAAHRDEDDRRALYAEIRDSLAAPGWPIRYAAADTALVSVPEPGPQDLDSYFRAHQADYARFDPKTGAIVTNSLAEVVDDVRRRYLRDQRQTEARALSERLLRVWQSGGHDAGLEAKLGARLTPAVVAGSRIDTGYVATVLSDTLWSLPDLQRGGLLPYKRGFIVWQGLARTERVYPTLEQAQKTLASRLERRRAAAELAAAKALYDANPDRFRRGDIIHFTRVAFRPRATISVPLNREEVNKWHREHIEKYSTPEMVTAKHILIVPANASAAADRQALAKAREVLRRLKDGEDFAELARTYSEDPATRENGGDLSPFTRGSMLEEFERVAFSLPSGTLYDQPVRTEVGYHLIKVVEHQPPVIKPLPQIYVAVSSDAASDKASRMAVEEAESLLSAVKDPRAFAEAGTRAGASVLEVSFGSDQRMDNPDAVEFFAALRATPAGHIMRGVFPVKGQGAWVAVVDSITPATTPTWDQARTEAVAQYRRGAGLRALDAKCAELDSMLAGGMSFDSLGAYWGGLLRVVDHAEGRPLRSTETTAELDSLLLGGRALEPGLPLGQVSGWLPRATGRARVRVESRTLPAAQMVAERAEQMRAAVVQEKLSAYFDGLKARYPVVILDRRLRNTPLVAGPPPATGR
jgi:parvulin-like peptidyl-prolyl isomerase